jgi:hypothetical protein
VLREPSPTCLVMHVVCTRDAENLCCVAHGTFTGYGNSSRPYDRASPPNLRITPWPARFPRTRESS